MPSFSTWCPLCIICSSTAAHHRGATGMDTVTESDTDTTCHHETMTIATPEGMTTIMMIAMTEEETTMIDLTVGTTTAVMSTRRATPLVIVSERGAEVQPAIGTEGKAAHTHCHLV